MSDEAKPPEELRRQFRIVGGSDTPEAVAALRDRLLTEEYLKAMDVAYEFYPSEKKPLLQEIMIEGVTVYIEWILEERKPDDGALGDPAADRFDFKF